MLLTSGGRFGGYGFYLLKGKPVFTWNLVDLKRVRWEAPEALAPGKHTVEFDFKYDGLGAATLAFNNTGILCMCRPPILGVCAKHDTIDLPVLTSGAAEATMAARPLVGRWRSIGGGETRWFGTRDVG